MIKSPHQLLAGLLVLCLSGCKPEPALVQESTIHGLPVRLEVATLPPAPPVLMASVIQPVLEGTLKSMDPSDPASDIGKLNRVANTVRLQVSRNLFRLIDLAHHYSERTGGLFDLTAYPLDEVWGWPGYQLEEPPSDALIEGIKTGVDYSFVEIFDQGAVAFTMPGTRLGFARIGPAYALDLALLDLRRRGYRDLLLQVGPMYRALGSRGQENPWRVDIPHLSGTNLVGNVGLDGAKSTLVILHANRPGIQAGGRNYNHIIDPRTGHPAEGTVLVAVLGPSATMAQVLAETLMVGGLDQAATLLGLFPKCEALMIPSRDPREVWTTSEFARRLRLDTSQAWSPMTLDRVEEEVSPPPEP